MNSQLPKQINENDQTGSLTIRVNIGYGLYPVEGALVTISRENGEAGEILSQSYTNASGVTPQIKLSVEGDNEKGQYLPAGEQFTIEVTKDGYRPLIYQSVLLYPLIDTLLTVNLIPLPDRPGVILTKYDEEIVV